MAARKTNRVALPSGPTLSDSSPVERQLLSRVSQVEIATGLVEASGSDPIVIEGGGTTIINNTYVTNNYTTGEPTTGGNLITPELDRFYYGPAVGQALRSAVTAAGDSLIGSYDIDGSTFYPSDNTATGYSVSFYEPPSWSATTPTAAQANGDYAVTNVWGVPTSDQFNNARQMGTPGTFGAQKSFHYSCSGGVVFYSEVGGVGGNTFYTMDTAGATTTIGTGLFTAHASIASSSRHAFLGSDSSGFQYFVVYISGGDGYVVKVDCAGMNSAFLSSGVQTVSNFMTLVSPANSSMFTQLNPDNDWDELRSCIPWSGGLTGRTYAWMQGKNGNLYSVNLSTGQVTRYSTGIPFFTSVTNNRSAGAILVRDVEWGTSSTSEFLGMAELSDGAGGTEFRAVKFNPSSYVDLTPVGSGQASGWPLAAYPSPANTNATMYFGGAPTHVTYYDPGQGGLQYVLAATL